MQKIEKLKNKLICNIKERGNQFKEKPLQNTGYYASVLAFIIAVVTTLIFWIQLWISGAYPSKIDLIKKDGVFSSFSNEVNTKYFENPVMYVIGALIVISFLSVYISALIELSMLRKTLVIVTTIMNVFLPVILGLAFHSGLIIGLSFIILTALCVWQIFQAEETEFFLKKCFGTMLFVWILIPIVSWLVENVVSLLAVILLIVIIGIAGMLILAWNSKEEVVTVIRESGESFRMRITKD